MFPGSGATVYYNEDGEPIGWSGPSAYDDEPFDDDFWKDDEEEPDAEEDESWRDDEEREGDGTSLRDEFLSAERMLGSW